eukprot:jgi/Orpsp1_1/1188499/evm.model.d7180000065285.1
MNLNYILKGIGLVIVLCISIANAEYAEYKGDCKDIYEYLDGKGYDADMDHAKQMKKENKFNMITTYHYTPQYELSSCSQIEDIPDIISNLTNLES